MLQPATAREIPLGCDADCASSCKESSASPAGMRRVELLSPAADLRTGILAIDAGADAVYIGPPRFGARAKAANSIHDIEALARHAHFFGARVYATLNTLLKDEELLEAQRLAWQLYGAGVDALIVQDMALLQMDLPPLPLHASTQTDNRSLAKVQFLEGVGFSRVVLARELSLEQIEEIGQGCSVELEVFVHGALCVCYSGQCYLSEHLTGRSANRGECAQPCRYSYTLRTPSGQVLSQDRHLLSLRDLNHTLNLRQLLQAGVTSFKIEGRMKDSAYIQNVTAHYSQHLNGLVAKIPGLRRSSWGSVECRFTPNPSRTFARPFTEYFLKGRPTTLVCADTPKALGEYIGPVAWVRGRRLGIHTRTQLANGDGLVVITPTGAVGLRADVVENGVVTSRQTLPSIEVGQPVWRNFAKTHTDQLGEGAAVRYLEVEAVLECGDYCELRSISDCQGASGDLACDGEENSQAVQHSTTATATSGSSRRSASLTLSVLWGGRTISIAIPIPETTELAKNAEGQRAVWIKQLGISGFQQFKVTRAAVLGGAVPFLPIAGINALRRRAMELLVSSVWRASEAIPPLCMGSCSIPRILYPTGSPRDFRLNIANHAALDFYRMHGVRKASITPIARLHSQGDELMRTKYCLRYELHLCPRQGACRQASPLILESGGKKLKLLFDCEKCEMVLEKL